MLYQKVYSHFYTTHLEQLIDKVILQQDKIQGAEIASTKPVIKPVSPSIQNRPPAVPIQGPSNINVKSDVTTHDFNHPSKTRSFLNHEPAEFEFIRPVREIHEHNNIKLI